MRVVAGEGAQRTLARARGLEIPLPGNPRAQQPRQGRVRTTRWRAHRCARSSSPAGGSWIQSAEGLKARPSLTSSAPDPQHAAKFLGARRRRRIRTAPKSHIRSDHAHRLAHKSEGLSPCRDQLVRVSDGLRHGLAMASPQYRSGTRCTVVKRSIKLWCMCRDRAHFPAQGPFSPASIQQARLARPIRRWPA